MGNATPFIIMIAINLTIFVGMGGLTGDVDIGFLDVGLRNTLDITQSGENSTISLNTTEDGADFSGLQGESGAGDPASIFSTLFIVLKLFANVIVASVGSPILIMFASGIPVYIAIPIAGTLTVLNVISIFMLVAGRS